ETAREDATRSIIRDALSKLGSKINEFVALGGNLEVTTGRGEDFSGQVEGVLRLVTAELEFEVQPNEWTLGRLRLAFDDGTSALFPSTTPGVDRFTLADGFITIGNPQKFPPYITAGQFTLPFGISTGHPVSDVLSVENPLTIEVFEFRNTAIGFGLGFPTP